MVCFAEFQMLLFIQDKVHPKKGQEKSYAERKKKNILKTVSLCRYYCYMELYTEPNYSNAVNHPGGVKMTVNACFPH